MSERPENEWQPEDPDPAAATEANPADVAEQGLPAEPDPEVASQRDLEQPLPTEAEPADVLEQRQAVPPEDLPEE